MGNKNSKIHLETAQKTGACTLSKLNLEQLPPDLFKIVKLRSLDISGNRLGPALPRDLQKFQNLKMLNVSANRLQQLDQTIFSQFSKLETFLAHSNLLYHMPSFAACKHLKTVIFLETIFDPIRVIIWSYKIFIK